MTDKEPEVIATSGDNAFNIPVMVIEGAWTGDKRFIDPSVLTWRELPLPVMAIKKTTQGHDEAELVGKLTEITRQKASEGGLIDPRVGEPYNEGTTYLSAKGTFDSSELAAEIHRLVDEGFLRGVSIDLGDVTSDIVFVDKEGNEVEGIDFMEWLFGPEDADEDDEGKGTESAADEPVDMADLTPGEKIREGRVMGVTICPFPAFEGAYIEIPSPMTAGGYSLTPSYIEGDEDEGKWPSVINHDMPGNLRQLPRRTNALIAAAAPVRPPANWFSNPKFAGKSALTINADGQVYGHLASWDECHISFGGQCIRAPRSASEYAYFATGAVLCDDEQLIPTGPLTMGTGHAELWEDANAAKAHYDNTGTAVADVVMGEDQFGIWFAGALRPDVDEVSIRRLRGSALSGDWRTRGGSLELVAALAVNTPGFPVVRPIVRVASGMPQAMVAAGMIGPATISRQNHSAADHRSAGNVSTKFDGVIRDALRSRVHTDSD